jgi:D-hydroxyproline dehydrogenase subunit beta
MWHALTIRQLAPNVRSADTPARQRDRALARGRIVDGVAPVPARRCVVIGAGVLGATVATSLAGSGMRVTLLEQDRPGHATSRWSFAWLNSNDKAPRHYHDLNHAGMKAWADLASDLDGDAWYRPAGHLELATDVAELTARVDRLARWGYPARLVDAAEAAVLEPSLRPRPGATAAWFGEEAYLLTEPLIDRLLARAVSRGAALLTGDQGRVTGLDGTKVRTAAGDIHQADEIVCCAGRWTPELAALAGQACPVPLVAWETAGSTAPGLVVQAGPVAPPGPVRILHTPELSLRPHSDGTVRLEAPDAAVDLHTPQVGLRRWAGELLGRARRTIRGLDDARVVDYRVCVRPLPVDGHPIVGRLPSAESLYAAVTHSGVTLAAHLARLITSDLTGTPLPELAPYRPARFISPVPPSSAPHRARGRSRSWRAC